MYIFKTKLFMSSLRIDINCCDNINEKTYEYYNTNTTPINWIVFHDDDNYNEELPEWYLYKKPHYRSYAYSQKEKEIINNNFINIINKFIIILDLKMEYSDKMVLDFILQNYLNYQININDLKQIINTFTLKHNHQ